MGTIDSLTNLENLSRTLIKDDHLKIYPRLYIQKFEVFGTVLLTFLLS